MTKKDQENKYNIWGIIISIIILISFVVFCLCLSTQNLQIAHAKQINPNITYLASSSAYIDKQYEFLKENTENFREEIQRERENLYKFLGFLMTVLGIGGIWGFIKIMHDSQKKIKLFFNEKLKENVKIVAKEKAEQTAKEEAREILIDVLGFKKKILIINENGKDNNNNIKSLLEKYEFENIEVKKLKDINENDTNDYKLIIIEFSKERTKEIKESYDKIISNNKDKVIIFYAPKEQPQSSEEDKNKADQKEEPKKTQSDNYINEQMTNNDNVIPANGKLALVNYVKTFLIRDVKS